MLISLTLACQKLEATDIGNTGWHEFERWGKSCKHALFTAVVIALTLLWNGISQAFNELYETVLVKRLMNFIKRY